MRNTKKSKAAGFWTQQRVNARRSPSLGHNMSVHGGEKATDWQSHGANVLQEKVLYLSTCCTKKSSHSSALNPYRKNHKYINLYTSLTLVSAHALCIHHATCELLPKSPRILYMSYTTPEPCVAAQLANPGVRQSFIQQSYFTMVTEKSLHVCLEICCQYWGIYIIDAFT